MVIEQAGGAQAKVKQIDVQETNIKESWLVGPCLYTMNRAELPTGGVKPPNLPFLNA